jgi:hypothetical protein
MAWERPSEAALFERDTDPFFFPPHNVAGRVADLLIAYFDDAHAVADIEALKILERRAKPD